ncbi:hypothetical protein BX666DRAFT_1439162 [Dichotomocladium elegans]|nr:hypothetical protein BX666DRAFT_1439162 [Dichotomocladium elegans]
MLESWANSQLLSKRWHSTEVGDKIYYVKYHFETNRYCILATDLRRVWSQCAEAAAIYALANQQNLDIENEDQLEVLLVQLWKLIQHLDDCALELSNGDDKHSLLKIRCREQKGIASLTWTFACKSVSCASDVLYDHFISPLLTMILMKEGQVKRVKQRGAQSGHLFLILLRRYTLNLMPSSPPKKKEPTQRCMAKWPGCGLAKDDAHGNRNNSGPKRTGSRERSNGDR